ncbi:MAG: AsmA family protein, partial [Acidobacteriota bacterium]
MSNDAHDRAGSISGQAASPGRKRRLGRRLWFVWIGALILLAGFLLPPLVNLGRYKNRITQLMSASFGRPVRLSSVELRLLPWPGFVLTDLRVEEDPAYGSEPVLYASTVTANIRLLSLWRGRLEIGSVSVDEASLNVVRTESGSWNLTPLFHTAAVQPGTPLHATALPYLEATDSRINFKYGAEKLPFSLINTDLSFWQEGPNEWRIRLRGQPARTDVSLDPADTGIVRVEASLDRAPALHDMPVHADVDWREAQLGQLSRLLVGSDEGWRGNLTGELHLDGTPGAAHVATRLQATGVHRAEFVPLSPLDFDANCSFVYHYRRRALDDLVCNSPLGDGHLRLAGKLQASQMPELTAELDRIPAEAGLDVLRATRSGIAPSLQAAGSISGSLVYRAAETDSEPIRARARRGRGHAPALRGEPLRGALTVEGFALSGGSLSLPLRAEKFVLEPAPASALNAHEPVMLAGTASFPAGGSAPLDVELHLAMKGYEAEIHGETSLARAREIEKTAGMGGRLIPDGLAGELMAVDLRASGPWQLSDQNSVSGPTSGP